MTRALELARECCPCWGDRDTGPEACTNTEVCELHHNIAALLERYAAEERRKCLEAPTGSEDDGFTGTHRLAAALMQVELIKAGVSMESDEATPYLAQFIANWERRGAARTALVGERGKG